MRKHWTAYPKRGFHAQEVPLLCPLVVYVRNGYELVRCEGEAHANAHIDNCGLCMSGLWEWRARLLTDGRKQPKPSDCSGCGCPLEKCGPQLWMQEKKCCPECAHA
jgi:hypothetical protein